MGQAYRQHELAVVRQACPELAEGLTTNGESVPPSPFALSLSKGTNTTFSNIIGMSLESIAKQGRSSHLPLSPP